MSVLCVLCVLCVLSVLSVLSDISLKLRGTGCPKKEVDNKICVLFAGF